MQMVAGLTGNLAAEPCGDLCKSLLAASGPGGIAKALEAAGAAIVPLSLFAGTTLLQICRANKVDAAQAETLKNLQVAINLLRTDTARANRLLADLASRQDWLRTAAEKGPQALNAAVGAQKLELREAMLELGLQVKQIDETLDHFRILAFDTNERVRDIQGTLRSFVRSHRKPLIVTCALTLAAAATTVFVSIAQFRSANQSHLQRLADGLGVDIDDIEQDDFRASLVPGLSGYGAGLRIECREELRELLSHAMCHYRIGTGEPQMYSISPMIEPSVFRVDIDELRRDPRVTIEFRFDAAYTGSRSRLVGPFKLAIDAERELDALAQAGVKLTWNPDGDESTTTPFVIEQPPREPPPPPTLRELLDERSIFNGGYGSAINLHSILQVRPMVREVWIGPTPEATDRSIELLDSVSREDMRADERWASPEEQHVFPPADWAKVYVRVIGVDGAELLLEWREEQRVQEPQRASWVRAASPAPDASGDAPPLLIGYGKTAGLKIQIDLPAGTQKALRLSQHGPFDMHGVGAQFGLQHMSLKEFESPLQVILQMADGSDRGPFEYKLDPIEPIVRAAWRGEVSHKRNELMRAERWESERDIDRARVGSAGVPKDALPAVACFVAGYYKHWGAIDEIRLGAAADKLDQVIRPGVPTAVLAVGTSWAQRSAEIPPLVFFPAGTQQVYALFVLDDGSTVGPVTVAVRGRGE